MNKIIFKRIFIFLCLMFAFTLVVLYIDEKKELMTRPYLSQIKNIMRNGENDFSEESITFAEPSTTFSELSTSTTSSKPSITSFKSSKLRSIEESWTYECIKNRCSRKFHSNINEERK